MAVKPSETKTQSRAVVFLVRLVIAMAVSAAAGIICLIYTNLGVLKNVGTRGTFDFISEDIADIVDDNAGSIDIAFKDSAGVFINKLVFDVAQAGEPRAIGFSISVRTSGYGGRGSLSNRPLYVEPDEEGYYTYTFADNNPIYVNAEVLDLGLSNVNSIHIETDGARIATSGFRIDNTVNKNLKAVAFASLFAMMLAVIIQWREIFSGKPEYLFLMTALSMGIAMISGMPKTKVGYDEETHMQAVLAMANYPDTAVHMSRDGLFQILITEYNNPNALPDGHMEVTEYEKALDEKCFYSDGSTTPEFAILWSRVPAYITMAAAVRMSDKEDLPWTEMVSSIRLANLLTYVILMFFAIRIVPYGKALMMLIGLFPQMIFMASTCSYDPFIVGSINLGYAFMLRGRKYIIPMVICLTLGCLPKAVYAPVLLMGIFMLSASGESSRPSPGLVNSPADAGRDRKKYTNLLIVFICGAVFIAIIAALILPTVINPIDSGDVRGGAVSESGQIGFILSHPFSYAGILLRQMIRDFGRCWFGADCMTYMAHLVKQDTDFKGYYVPYMVILVLLITISHAGRISGLLIKSGRSASDVGRRACTEEQSVSDVGRLAYNEERSVSDVGRLAQDDRISVCDGLSQDKLVYSYRPEAVRLTAARRIWIVLMVMFSSVLIWTAMYVAFTEPGAQEIAGVQGRYFIPLMFPLYLALCGNTEMEKCHCQMRFTYLTGLAELITLGATVWTAVILPFCL